MFPLFTVFMLSNCDFFQAKHQNEEGEDFVFVETRHVTSKKMGCPAAIYAVHICRFPEYKVRYVFPMFLYIQPRFSKFLYSLYHCYFSIPILVDHICNVLSYKTMTQRLIEFSTNSDFCVSRYPRTPYLTGEKNQQLWDKRLKKTRHVWG